MINVIKQLEKIYGVSVNKYGVKCGTSLRFWENKGWIRPIDPYGWLQWYFRYRKGRGSEDDQRQINRWKIIVSRFNSILIKMISKDKDSPKIRRILLHWGYELVDKKKIKSNFKLIFFVKVHQKRLH